jgi:phage terminase large subunit-like protein
MPRSVSDLETAVMRGTLRVRKNPVLTWNSASAVLESDATDNRKWEKRKSTGRIDGIVALCMAVGLAQTEPKAQTTGWLL